MAAAAKKYPDVKFEMATGTIDPPRTCRSTTARGEDAIYLSGIAAGAATKTGTVGYVVPFAIPEVIRHTNAFTLGVQKAHPGAKVKIIWTNSWFAPDKEKKAAESLHSAGADVIGQNVDSPAAGQYAESAGHPVGRLRLERAEVRAEVVAHRRGLQLGPVLHRARVKAAMNGTWKTGNYYGSLKDGFTMLAPFGTGVSAATKKLIAQEKALIDSGKWNEFSGPIYDQSGQAAHQAGRIALSVRRAVRR